MEKRLALFATHGGVSIGQYKADGLQCSVSIGQKEMKYARNSTPLNSLNYLTCKEVAFPGSVSSNDHIVLRREWLDLSLITVWVTVEKGFRDRHGVLQDLNPWMVNVLMYIAQCERGRQRGW
jgi:hypothetical protein